MVVVTEALPEPSEEWLDLRGKKASQSSTAIGGAAQRAIDGNANTNYKGKSCTHTDNKVAKPWWQVELGSDQNIKEVQVTNRGDCCGKRLNGFNVYVDGVICASKQNISQGETKTVACNRRGKTVKVDVDHSQKKKKESLTICEFKVKVGGQKAAAPAAPKAAAPALAPAAPKAAAPQDPKAAPKAAGPKAPAAPNAAAPKDPKAAAAATGEAAKVAAAAKAAKAAAAAKAAGPKDPKAAAPKAEDPKDPKAADPQDPKAAAPKAPNAPKPEAK